MKLPGHESLFASFSSEKEDSLSFLKVCSSLLMLAKRSFSLAGHRTSIALEPEFWDALQQMAAARAASLAAFVAEIDAARSPAQPLASALRVAALNGAQTNRRSD